MHLKKYRDNYLNAIQTGEQMSHHKNEYKRVLERSITWSEGAEKRNLIKELFTL